MNFTFFLLSLPVSSTLEYFTVLYIDIRYSVLPPPLFNHAHRLSDSREILINIKHFHHKLFILLEGIQFISSINKCSLSFKKSALLFIENRKPTSQEWFVPVLVLNHSSSEEVTVSRKVNNTLIITSYPVGDICK